MLLVRIEHISGTRIKKFQEGLNRTRIMITIKIVFIYPTHSLIPLPLSPPIKIVLFVKKKKRVPSWNGMRWMGNCKLTKSAQQICIKQNLHMVVKVMGKKAPKSRCRHNHKFTQSLKTQHRKWKGI